MVLKDSKKCITFVELEKWLTGTQAKIEAEWRDKLEKYPKIMADMSKAMTMPPQNKRQRFN